MTAFADQCINSTDRVLLLTTFLGESEGKLAPFLPSSETQGQIVGS